MPFLLASAPIAMDFRLFGFSTYPMTSFEHVGSLGLPLDIEPAQRLLPGLPPLNLDSHSTISISRSHLDPYISTADCSPKPTSFLKQSYRPRSAISENHAAGFHQKPAQQGGSSSSIGWHTIRKKKPWGSRFLVLMGSSFTRQFLQECWLSSRHASFHSSLPRRSPRPIAPSGGCPIPRTG